MDIFVIISISCLSIPCICKMGRVKRIWYLSPMRAAKVQASLRIRAVSPEPPLLAHTSSESRGTFRQKARSLAPLNDWACAVKICHDGMLEDTNSLDAAHVYNIAYLNVNILNSACVCDATSDVGYNAKFYLRACCRSEKAYFSLINHIIPYTILTSTQFWICPYNFRKYRTYCKLVKFDETY